MVVRMRSTRGHTGNRRSHHALKTAQFVVCKKCGSQSVPHTICVNCGEYKGRQVIDVMAKLNKKEQKIKEQEISEEDDK